MLLHNTAIAGDITQLKMAKRSQYLHGHPNKLVIIRFSQFPDYSNDHINCIVQCYQMLSSSKKLIHTFLDYCFGIFIIIIIIIIVFVVVVSVHVHEKGL